MIDPRLFGEYTDRYTPELSRLQGYKHGLETARLIAAKIQKPTKQVLNLIAELEKKINEENLPLR